MSGSPSISQIASLSVPIGSRSRHAEQNIFASTTSRIPPPYLSIRIMRVSSSRMFRSWCSIPAWIPARRKTHSSAPWRFRYPRLNRLLGQRKSCGLNDLFSISQLFVLYQQGWRDRQAAVPQDDFIDNVTTLNAPLSPEPIAPQALANIHATLLDHPTAATGAVHWLVGPASGGGPCNAGHRGMHDRLPSDCSVE
ncbi:hypothetical protein NSPZN2_100171 [Nitrospira defluvii]|uniref:Uncharacterized protein n=1 Tax=Nitrospira defluvii TaxID=330214 RepID=A0ABM8R143_9BACT|nr:hypothetical protein NSPZN2_100171 [Nitrospira defluvii]